MTVGEYAETPLQDPGDTWRHGAVFLLRKASPFTESVSVNGWTTTVVGGVRAVITRGPLKARKFDATFDTALEMANKGLDLMCVQGLADCAIRAASEDCLVWWPDPPARGVVMRANIVPTNPIDIRTRGVTPPDAGGNAVPSPPPPTPPTPPTPMIDDTYRFIRMCRTSDDLYDSYRNLFLAFECLLSDIRPPQRVARRRCFGLRRPGPNGPWEPDKRWFMDALSKAGKLVSLASLTPPEIQKNHEKWVYKHMYQAERCALMHAKRGRDEEYLLPQGGVNRDQLIDSLARLSSYIRKLIDAHPHLGVRYRGGYLTDAARRLGAQAVVGGHVVVVSDDAGPVNPQGVNPISEAAAIVKLQSGAPTEDPDDPGFWTVLAHCDVADLNTLTAIRKFGLKPISGDGPACVGSELFGPLSPGSSVVRLEVLYGRRVVNRSDPPSVFSS
jgi:hypothetical protein